MQGELEKVWAGVCARVRGVGAGGNEWVYGKERVEKSLEKFLKVQLRESTVGR